MTRLITESLDIWLSAQKPKKTGGRGRGKTTNGGNLYGIKKLRELILELAVRGKLVPQDPNDEPASKLLKKITHEKTRLIKEGKIKKPKKLPEIGEDEKPFELPEGWEWTRLQDISSYIQRGKGPKYTDMGRVLVISQKCIQWEGFDLAKARFIEDSSLNAYQPERFLKQHDLLWNSTGTGTVGRINVLGEVEPNTLVADSHVTVIRPLEINSTFLWCYFAAPGIQLRISPEHENSLVSGTTKQVELNTSSVTPLIVPLPPLAEQLRIVAKVDELMALCDRLEEQQTESDTTHQTLLETLLATLTNAADNNEFNQAWQRLAHHFDTLFTTEKSIDQLKQTILQLAVMGKLVRQDPNDEPASELLKKIAQEKARQIKEGKIKKQKKLPEISEEEKPFELQEGWEWIRVWDIAMLVTSGSRDWAKYYSDTGAIFVTMGNLSKENYKLRLETLRYVNPPRDGEGSRTKLETNDLLISITGDVGNLGLIPKNFGEAYINQHTCLLRFMPKCQNRFFPELMRSPLAKYQFDAPQRGIKNSFRLSDVGEMIIPLPPLAEQHRIVAKVDELMTLCDTLKDRLTEAQTTQLQLADTLVEQTGM